METSGQVSKTKNNVINPIHHASNGKSTDFSELLDMYESTFNNLEEGSIIEGNVVAIKNNEVLLDIGYKTEGVMSFNEFTDEELKNLKIGDTVKVYLEERENAEGNLVLSKEKADKIKIWETLEEACKEGRTVTGAVISRIKGGMIVDIGVKAFLPGSQIDLRPVKDMDGMIGKKIDLKVLKINHKRGNIVVSRRAILEELRESKRKNMLSSLEEGKVVEGIVKNITEYGVFLDLGGIDGLLHITDISWGRVNHPSDLFMVGDKIQVVVLKYDKANSRVSLGLKQKSQDPWGNIETKYAIGSKIKGKVVSVVDYGIFVEIEPGIEGLVHISEMSWSQDVKHPSKLVGLHDEIEAAVLHIDKDNRKISLGIKQLGDNPWDVIAEKHPVGSRVKGVVRNITDFGVFVGLEEGVDGLIHISDISWTKHIKHPSEVFKKGQEMEAVVLKIDKAKGKLSLGYKQLFDDPWKAEVIERFKVGDIIEGSVVKVADFGIFMKLVEGIEGLIHVSEAGFGSSEELTKNVNIGDEIRARIIKIDPAERKIALSIKACETDYTA